MISKKRNSRKEKIGGIQYLALLRGINVGGNNVIRMADLKACFERLGFTEVVTYIQSGNVLFDSTEKDSVRLEEKIEKALFQSFKFKPRVVLVTSRQLQEIVEQAPAGFGQKPEEYRYDVLFLKSPLTAAEAMKEISVKEGVDEAWAGRHALYFSRLISKASQSHLARIIALPIYPSITIRNWNSTSKLLSLMERENA